MADAEPNIVPKKAGATLTQVLMDRISQRIMRGEYRPGDRLVEGDLAADFGVGRGSVREALRRLEANRYVVFEPNRGTMVARPSSKQVTDMLRVRAVISGLSARAAAERIDLPGHRDILSNIISEIEAELSGKNPGLHRRGNGHFHRTLNELSGMSAVSTNGTDLRL